MTKFDETGNCTDDRLKTSMDKLITELNWFSTAFKTHAASNGPPY